MQYLFEQKHRVTPNSLFNHVFSSTYARLLRFAVSAIFKVKSKICRYHEWVVSLPQSCPLEHFFSPYSYLLVIWVIIHFNPTSIFTV